MAASLSGCLGSHSKPKPVTSIDEPLKGPKLQGQKVSKPSISEDFWTTSACDMDNSAVQSRGSISSISTSNLIMDTHGSSSGNTSSEFVNHGNWNATYESLLGSSKPFSQPVPLAEMVDFLVDIWEQEGMYD
ncbi:hypothetical protein RHGRI_024872 [Rhododendron griersonianum]|uniref:Gag1-like clamp domain-containing protein n=1 Tax=Rhododendron griersonianum TaxID=479676 RepID=A0AAV6JB46_9ERIC|nr:hypothetical protein RHGRI_024872 [Rhododendron griersonianum]